MSGRRLCAAGLIGLLTAGCGLMAERRERHEAEVVGDRLVTAGFRRVPADTPARQAELGRLPKLLFAATTTKGGERRYLLADPDRCRCLYVGDEGAYRVYTDAELRQEGVDSTRAAERADRNAGVNDLPFDFEAFEIDIEMHGG